MKRETITQNDYTSLIALEAMIESSMKKIRGKQVMLSSDVAKLYHVTPEYLHKQVKKNIDRFPKEFMFKLNLKELAMFKEEKFPFVFTEQGILMTGGSLKSEQAIKIHVQLIRYFVQLFNQAVKDVSLMEKIETLTKGEEIFDALKKMLKKQNL
ncbi:MAG: ORF6N domain-containing protein [Bacteroidetes bacterium]|nr:MAG: ORF6N domain-containing protein [Bacteroidota bacterium]